MQIFDLTTSRGRRKAADYYRQGSFGAWVSNPLATLFFAAEQMIQANAESTSIDEQRQAAVDIIRQGQDSGVKKMKVTLVQEAGANFSVPIEGVKISAMVGSKGKMTLEVEYK